MTTEEITATIEDIGKHISLTHSYLPEWNPIEEFIKYVSPKEICHSRILAQFLNPNGPHGDGTAYLTQFLYVNGIEDFTDGTPGIEDANVTTERSISSGRKIDIFIEWNEPTGEKRAVIIENKLNGAAYQPNQLEDYRDAIEKEGYDNVKVVALHVNEKPEDSLIKADSIMYASDIANNMFGYLLEKKCISNDYMHYGVIYPYLNYLLSLSLNNSAMDTAKQILNLDPTTFTKLAALVQAFSKLNDAKDQWLLEQIKLDFPDISSGKGTLEGISFWRKDDYERNGCWVCVHYPKPPENDERGTDLWLVAEPEYKAQADAIAAKLGFTFREESKYKSGQNARWYYKSGEYRFQFFTEKSDLLLRIKEILKALSD